MRDPAVRGALHAAFLTSSVAEKKLFFKSYVQGRGKPLLAAMARADGSSESAVLSLLEELRPLEIYLPVEAHRRAWKGGKNLLVATLESEEAAPFAVDLNGTETVLSLDSPPSVPTIVLVPAESFDSSGRALDSRNRGLVPAACDPSQISCPGGGGGNPPSNAVWRRGIAVREFISHMRAIDDHEPWPLGDPDFELFIAGTRDLDGQAELMRHVNIVPEDAWAGSRDDENDNWRSFVPNIQLLDWDFDYGSRVRVRCLEDDNFQSNGSLTVSGSSVIRGVTVSFSGTFQGDMGGDDDDCGSTNISFHFSDGTFGPIPDGPDRTVSPIDFDGTSDLHWYGYGIPLN